MNQDTRHRSFMSDEQIERIRNAFKDFSKAKRLVFGDWKYCDGEELVQPTPTSANPHQKAHIQGKPRNQGSAAFKKRLRKRRNKKRT